MLNEKYTYQVLNTEYERLNEFIHISPPIYHEKNQRGFLIEKEKPITGINVENLLLKFQNKLEEDNDTTQIVLHNRNLKIFEPFLGREVDYFEGLNKVKLPFGLRDFVKMEVSEINEEQCNFTSYYTFAEEVIAFTIELEEKKIGKTSGLDQKTLFTSHFTESLKDKGWVDAVKYTYRRLTGKTFEFAQNFSNDETLLESVEVVIFAAMKLGYSGFVKELYTKLVILTHPKVISGEIGVYRTNGIGDGLGIDFMLKNKHGKWNTVGVTSTKFRNKKCDIKFEFSKKVFDCKEVIPNSWIYVPKDYHSIYNKIEEFSHVK